MKSSGPPKKPSRLKLIQGTFRSDRAPRKEATPPRGIPEVPEHLSDLAKVEWGRISQDLYQIGLLSRIDRGALAAYCECWSDWVEATRMCSTLDGKDRKTMTTQTGNLVENPYFSIKKRCAELMHKFLTEFGMTPAARARIDVSAHLPSASADTDSSKWGGIG
jgi:P27 family predicted phage terminase small subunit